MEIVAWSRSAARCKMPGAVQAERVCRQLLGCGGGGGGGGGELPVAPRVQILQLFNKSFESLDKFSLTLRECASRAVAQRHLTHASPFSTFRS
eukprot:4735389-Pleurochrysis_carterae.AAC.1